MQREHNLRAASVCYGVATISRRLKMIGLSCKRALLNRRYSANETYILRRPIIVATLIHTTRSQNETIGLSLYTYLYIHTHIHVSLHM